MTDLAGRGKWAYSYGSYDDCRLLHIKLTAAMLILERLGFHVCGSDREEFIKEVDKIKKQWDEGSAESRLT